MSLAFLAFEEPMKRSQSPVFGMPFASQLAAVVQLVSAPSPVQTASLMTLAEWM